MLKESWHLFFRNIPGYRVLLSPTSKLGLILPRIPVICRGNNHFFEDKHARTLIHADERQHNWFRCRSFWICRLGCNFHSKASLTVCLTWTLNFTDYPGVLIPKWANPCPRRCCSYQSQEFQILQSSYYSFTLRKWQQQELDFRNLHVNMNSFQSMVPIS